MKKRKYIFTYKKGYQNKTKGPKDCTKHGRQEGVDNSKGTKEAAAKVQYKLTLPYLEPTQTKKL